MNRRLTTWKRRDLGNGDNRRDDLVCMYTGSQHETLKRNERQHRTNWCTRMNAKRIVGSYDAQQWIQRDRRIIRSEYKAQRKDIVGSYDLKTKLQEQTLTTINRQTYVLLRIRVSAVHQAVEHRPRWSVLAMTCETSLEDSTAATPDPPH